MWEGLATSDSEHYCCYNSIVGVTFHCCTVAKVCTKMSASRQLIDAFKDGDKRLAQHSNRGLYVWSESTTFQSLMYNKQLVEKVSLLHLAAYWGWNDFSERLVTSDGANKDGEGHIPLHYAAYNGHLDLVRYFITARRCNPIAENNYKSTPLHLACRNGQLNVVQYLITSEAQCNPSCRDFYGDTPLHYACSKGHLNIAKYLIREARCNPLCENCNGSTPLHYACSNGHLDTSPSTSAARDTVTHHVQAVVVIPHFMMLVVVVTSKLSSTSSMKHTVTHHVLAQLGDHFTMLVVMDTLTLSSTSSERHTVTHHVWAVMAVHHFTMLVPMAT